MVTHRAASAGEVKKQVASPSTTWRRAGNKHAVLDSFGTEGLFNPVKGFTKLLGIHRDVWKEHELSSFMADYIFLSGLPEHQVSIPGVHQSEDECVGRATNRQHPMGPLH